MDKNKSQLSNIMEIMNIVIKRIEASGQRSEGSDPMVSQLLDSGFCMEDIDTAMGLVAMITQKVDPIVRVSDRERAKDGSLAGVRQLHALEAVRLTPDAQRYLLASLEEGSITPLQFEKTLVYLQNLDLRGVTKSRLELILMMNKPISHDCSTVEEDITPSFSSTIH